MDATRRQFIHSAAAATGAALLVPGSVQAASQAGKGRKLDLLILGGTGFLGPHIVRTALERGHQMTLFNRGRTNPHLFPDLEKLRGDRDPERGDGLQALEQAVAAGRRWDAVFDTSGYVPRIVAASAGLLARAAGHYLFVSSVSAYASFEKAGIREEDPVGTLEDPSVEAVTGSTYGPLKALCEVAAEKAFPGHATNIRPGLIVGPGDPSGRFTYWPVRIQEGGEVLGPGAPTDPAQWIDARDLAAFCVHCVEDQVAGVFNAVGPEADGCIGELLYGCKAVTGGDVRVTWVPASFLEERGLGPWAQFPVWAPPESELAGLCTVRIDRALAAGLTLRPLADTVAATLEYWNGLEEDDHRKRLAALTREQEAETLAAWRERGG